MGGAPFQLFPRKRGMFGLYNDQLMPADPYAPPPLPPELGGAPPEELNFPVEGMEQPQQVAPPMRDAMRLALQPPSYTPVARPPAPDFEPTPRRPQPRGFKQTMAEVLKGFVPGYVQAENERYGQDVADTRGRNANKMAVYKELMDAAGRENTLSERTLNHQMLAEARQEVQQRLREKEAADQQHRADLLRLQQEKLAEEKRQADIRFRDQYNRHMQDSEFFDTQMAPGMRVKGQSEDVISTARNEFLQRRHSTNPLEQRIETLQSHGVDPSSEQLLNMAGATRQPQQPATVIVPYERPDGSTGIGIADKTTREIRPLTVPGGADAKKPKPNQSATSLKVWAPAQDADTRLSIMEKAAKSGAQGDVSLLFNHIGMTLSAQKGARITQTEIERAIKSRSVPEGLLAAYDSVTTGKFLSPQQRTQMIQLAREMRREQWIKARAAAANVGLPGEPPGHPDLPPVATDGGAGGGHAAVVEERVVDGWIYRKGADGSWDPVRPQ